MPVRVVGVVSWHTSLTSSGIWAADARSVTSRPRHRRVPGILATGTRCPEVHGYGNGIRKMGEVQSCELVDGLSFGVVGGWSG